MAIQVIQKFRNRITSDPKGITKTWVGNDICKDNSRYRGFICNKSPTDGKLRVAGVNFNELNFAGKSLYLNNFIEELKDLVIFHVNSNNFTGTVPAKISNLYELDLSNNKLTGAFPSPVLAATNLTFLDLRFNGLSGRIPPQIFTLDLDVLFLNNNFFEGKIPKNLGSSPVLFLTLANNKFTGPIPKSIGKASNTLREALFLNNQLSGCLPYQIGLLKRATVIDISKNLLTGPIPHSFGCLEKMKQLNLAYNRFSGEVPEILCKLGDLLVLTLKFNYFTQVGPECRKLMKRKVLDVSMNCILDLPSQRNATECKSFFLKQRSCPDKRLYNYIPCDIDHSTSKKRLDGTPSLSTSYAALIQNR